jgi:hypothetical protein
MNAIRQEDIDAIGSAIYNARILTNKQAGYAINAVQQYGALAETRDALVEALAHVLVESQTVVFSNATVDSVRRAQALAKVQS